jgi:hypothetical protein
MVLGVYPACKASTSADLEPDTTLKMTFAFLAGAVASASASPLMLPQRNVVAVTKILSRTTGDVSYWPADQWTHILDPGPYTRSGTIVRPCLVDVQQQTRLPEPF